MNRYQRITIGIVDLSALLIVVLYSGLAWVANARLTTVLPPIDPVWAQVQQRGTLRVATDVGFRPFADEQNGVLQGYDIDLARAIAERLGVQAEFIPTGFDALYDALTSGKADLVASALPYAPELGYRARFSTIYFDAGLMLVVPDSSPVREAGDLAGQRLGVELGSDADNYARRLVAANERIILRNDYDEASQAIADLRRGTLDAVIVDHITALTAVQSAPGLRIALPLTSDPYVLALPPAAFQLEAEVNRALEALRAEGFFAELNSRWFREQ